MEVERALRLAQTGRARAADHCRLAIAPAIRGQSIPQTNCSAKVRSLVRPGRGARLRTLFGGSGGDRPIPIATPPDQLVHWRPQTRAVGSLAQARRSTQGRTFSLEALSQSDSNRRLDE